MDLLQDRSFDGCGEVPGMDLIVSLAQRWRWRLDRFVVEAVVVASEYDTSNIYQEMKANATIFQRKSIICAYVEDWLVLALLKAIQTASNKPLQETDNRLLRRSGAILHHTSSCHESGSSSILR